MNTMCPPGGEGIQAPCKKSESSECIKHGAPSPPSALPPIWNMQIPAHEVPNGAKPIPDVLDIREPTDHTAVQRVRHRLTRPPVEYVLRLVQRIISMLLDTDSPCHSDGNLQDNIQRRASVLYAVALFFSCSRFLCRSSFFSSDAVDESGKHIGRSTEE